ncbi:MAG: Na+/H+ antiporter NhaA [Flavobacteriales bacterium]|nr:Na+/H+ antiporter NhaA [Flavobacteriales bacterium]
MTVFFLMVGLELERELYIGELSGPKQAMLPALAAVGGMLVPAGIYALLNHGTPTADGAGIPMATDIAFAIGVLALLGDRVPLALKIFLTALAVMDDLGAILTIAIFYSHDLNWAFLGGAMGLFGVLGLLNRLKVMRLAIYLPLGVVLWYLMMRSGVHATISGVLLAFAIPFRRWRRTKSLVRAAARIAQASGLRHHAALRSGEHLRSVGAELVIRTLIRWQLGHLPFGLVGKPLGIALFSGVRSLWVGALCRRAPASGT